MHNDVAAIFFISMLAWFGLTVWIWDRPFTCYWKFDPLVVILLIGMIIFASLVTYLVWVS